MAMSGGVRRYSGVAMIFHWLTALLVLGLIPVGFIMVNLGSGPLQNTLFDLHRSFGTVVLAVVALRLGYRILHGAPPQEPSVAPWQRVVSEIVHWALYALLIVQPLVGWAGTSAFGARISVFGLFTLPDLVGKDEALSETLLGLHGLIGFALAGLAAMHIAAALHHHFVLRDNVLKRMMPGR